MGERFYLYDDTVNAAVRFVSFVGERQRFDLALMETDRFLWQICRARFCKATALLFSAATI